MSRNGICLMLDRLHAGFLGAYGNAEIETSALDAFAGESFVADNCHIDSPQLPRIYRSLWCGGHAMFREEHVPPSWLTQALTHNIQTFLLTDDAELAYSPYREDFTQAELIPELRHSLPCQNAEQTQLYYGLACLHSTAERLATLGKPYLLWCHLRGFAGHWDFPLKNRERYSAANDPKPYSKTAVPWREKKTEEAEEDFADACQSVRAAYSGGIGMFDELFEPVFDSLRDGLFGDETLFLLAGARGLSLGEHKQIGVSPVEKEPLYRELVQTPLIVRFPDGFAQTVRSGALIQPHDVGNLLREWFGLPSNEPKRMMLIAEEIPLLRDHILIDGTNGESAIVTPSWFLRVPRHDTAPELYVKPDDRWEVNDVSNRCDEIAGPLLRLLDARKEQLAQGILEHPVPISSTLRERYS
ncbi:MAG: hypothetical protein LBQ54_01490 [Planctomycetaceae bacterium]|jgi:hypothetical protein|nr:hypothetical protein [Planctomycetaceae bacterium]